MEKDIIIKTREKIISSFNDLEFVEGPHKYYRHLPDGSKDEYTPVSYIIRRWFDEFDADSESARYAVKIGSTQEEVLKSWRYTNLLATTTGTLVHEYGESYSWLQGGHPENITEICKHQYVKEENWLIPTRPKEYAVRNFWKDLNPSLSFAGAEFKMHTGYLGCKTKMSGTFDLLLYYEHPTDKAKSGFVLCDWKTNKDLHSSFNRSQNVMMKPPFEEYYNEPLGHYILQFGCYQIMLESIGIPIIGRRLIWLKDDMNYEVIKIPDVTEKLSKLL